VKLEVGGAPLRDGGVDDLWRMSRLKWLNSRLGIDEGVVAPYTPLTRQGDTVDLLDRTVRFGASGLPESIRSRGHEILAGPITLTADGAKAPAHHVTRVTKATAAVIDRLTRTDGGDLDSELRARMEFDGCLTYALTVRAEHDLDLRDMRLEIPMKPEFAKYLMGFAVRGGARPPAVRWKWNLDHADNQVWLGDVDGGLQLTLQPDKDAWDVVTLRDAGLPVGWNNAGKGGCDVLEESGKVVVRAYTGPRKLAKGERA